MHLRIEREQRLCYIIIIYILYVFSDEEDERIARQQWSKSNSRHRNDVLLDFARVDNKRSMQKSRNEQPILAGR